jgi:hypothetical protein
MYREDEINRLWFTLQDFPEEWSDDQLLSVKIAIDRLASAIECEILGRLSRGGKD